MASEWDQFQRADNWDQFARADAAPPQKERTALDVLRTIALGGARGAGSIGATLMTPYDLVAGNTKSIGNPERRQAMDEAARSLGADTESPLYQGPKLLTEIAGTMGAGGAIANTAARVAPAAAARFAPALDAVRSGGFVAPGAGIGTRTAGGAVTGLGAAGLVNPDDAMTGAAIGGALPGATKFAGYAGDAIGSALRPSVANPELATKAIRDYNIPLGPSDISKSSLMKGARSILDDAMFVGKIGERRRDGIQSAFNREVGRTFGAAENSLTPEVIDAAKKRMGAEFDRIWNNNSLAYDGDLFSGIQRLRQEADKLPAGDSARLMSWLDDFERKAVPGPNNELFVPGDVANRFQSKLRQEAEKATGFLKDSLSTLRNDIIGAFNRSVSPEDAAALSKNRGQYKAFKTVQPLLQSAEAGVAGREAGNVPAGLLPQAVRKSYGDNISKSPFADLSQIGSQYVADRVARTGGSSRALLQNTAVGAALGTGAFTNPLATAAVIPAAAGIESLLSSPRAARAMLPKDRSIRGLLDQLEAERLLYLSAPVAGSSL